GQQATQPFSLLGVTWTPAAEDTEVEAEVRVRDADGWTDWEHLHVHEDGPGGDATAGTAPLWVGEADGVEARVLTSDGAVPRDLQVSLIDPGTMASDATVAPQASTTAGTTAGTTAAGSVSKPAIITRRGWGADESLRSHCSNGRFTKTVNVAFVHHTAGSNSYSKSQSKALVRGIYAYHTRSRGWCDIGYNFLVDRYGQIFEGRFGGRSGMWQPVYGAHTGGYNNNSVGVSLMGNFETANPPTAMMNATARIVAWKVALNYRDPMGAVRLNGKRFRVISGHRDASATACPGRNVYSRLPWLRQRTDAMIGTYSSAIYKKWQRLGGRGGFVRAPYWGEHASAGGTVARFLGADLLHTSGPGTHEVHGAIRNRYRRLGSENSVLKFPKSDERSAAAPGALQNIFQRGRIYWSKGTGAHEVYGKILKRYASLGGASGRLRLPTTGEYTITGGRAQKFQGGQIRWNRSTNTTRVIFN
ncbi:MAG: N-acetylmuramoyl-L-alanine amidase, partial [Thermocrispum sp.]